MSTLKKYTLGEVTESIFSGGTPATTNQNFWNGDLQWLSSGETRNRYINETEKSITKEGAINSSTRLALPDDVVIASAGQGFTRGQTSYSLIETYVNQSLIVLRANPSIINSKFLFFNFCL